MSVLIGSKYQLLQELGRGGMARVTLARLNGPSMFERRVVVKQLLPQHAQDPEFVALFEREARLSAMLTHPNVVQVIDYGYDGEAPYLVLEYVDGASLRQLLARARAADERADVRLTCRIFAQVAEGLAAAHDSLDVTTQTPLKLVHRDVSPDNILLSKEGAVKVSDFGVARAMAEEANTSPNIVRGKLNYAAPEQLDGLAVTGQADQWALGVCLYEALAGTRPFDREMQAAMVSAIVRAEYQPLETVRPDCPEALLHIVRRCLTPNAHERWPDCHELSRALELVVAESGGPVASVQIGSWVVRLLEGANGPSAPPQPAALERPVPSSHEAPNDGDGSPQGLDHRFLAVQPNEPVPAPLAPSVPNTGAAVDLRFSAIEHAAGALRESPGRLEWVPHTPATTPAPSLGEADLHGRRSRQDELPRIPDARPDEARRPPLSKPAPKKHSVGSIVALGLLGAVVSVLALGGLVYALKQHRANDPVQLIVTSSPAGASVVIDGQEVGVTPWGGDANPTIEHDLELTLPGYQPWKSRVDAGVSATFEVQFKRRRP